MLGQVLGTIMGDRMGRLAQSAPMLSQVLAGNQQSGQQLQMPQMQQTQKETPKLSRPVDNIIKLLPMVLGA